MKRVFFFTDSAMKVFEWDHKTLLGSLEFGSDELGFILCQEYLQTSYDMPSYLVVDILEEDFFNENIPHVSYFDRTKILDRLKQKFHRDNQYVSIELVGRNEEGRRDDNVLISSISNNEKLDQWLQFFKENNIEFPGLISAAKISEKFIGLDWVNQENVMIVARNMRDSIRESYFLNRRIRMSRLAKLPKSLKGDSNASSANIMMDLSIEKMYQFLLNKKLVKPNKDFNVYCLMNFECEEESCDDISYFRDDVNGRMHYHYVPKSKVVKDLGLKGCNNAYFDDVFSYLCTQTKRHKPHYLGATNNLFFVRQFLERNLKKILCLGSYAFILAALFVFFNTYEKYKKIVSYEELHVDAESAYNENYSHLADYISDSSVLSDSVDMIDLLNQESNVHLHGTFQALGSVFSESKFSMFSLKSMAWNKYTPREFLSLQWDKTALAKFEENAVISQSGYGGSSGDGTDYEGSYEGGYEDGYEDGYESQALAYKPVLRLEGVMDTSGYSYQQVVDITHDFARSLDSIAFVENVYLLSLPVDHRSDYEIKDSAKFSEAATKKGHFEVAILINGAFKHDSK